MQDGRVVSKVRRSADIINGIIIKRSKGGVSYLWNQLMAFMGNCSRLRMPVELIIEPSNVCNLKCPVCETGSGKMSRPQGMMSFGDFKKIMDEAGPYLNSVVFYFMGEPFLNKDAYKMIRYAKRFGVYVSSCTNGEFVDPEETAACGIDEINFQVGGITQETHGYYRVNGNLSRTMNNLKALADAKRSSRKKNPKVVLGFIVMKHNEAEIEGAKSMAQETGADELHLISPCVRDMEQAREFLPARDEFLLYDRAEMAKGMLKPKLLPQNRCYRLWHSAVVSWDGDVVPCCRDPLGEFSMGNALKDGFRKIWNGPAFNAFRRRILKEQVRIPMCQECSYFGIPGLYPSN